MKFQVMLTGVGGEGVLTSGAIIARAANIEGHFVRGVQLHGLAQRGGTIPTTVCFGSKKEIFSPGIMLADADLIIAFEPLEAARAVNYARKEKTAFVISKFPYMPVYANLLDMPYPGMPEIIKRIKPFSKKTLVFNAHDIASKQFGNSVFGNTLLIGAAAGSGLLPLSEKSLRKAIKDTAPKETETNLKAFEFGLKLGKQK